MAQCSQCTAGVNVHPASDFRTTLENSRKPRGKGVESRWIKQEIRHHEEWHEDQQSVDPMPYRWRYFSHPAIPL